MKKIFFLVIFVPFFLSACGLKNEPKDATEKIDYGSVYQAGKLKVYRKFFKDGRFFLYSEEGAQYSSEEELKKRQSDDDTMIYPKIEVAEGVVSNQDGNYVLITKRQIILTFKDVSHLKQKIVSRIDENYPQDSTLEIRKTNAGYQVMGKIRTSLYENDREIPDSIDDFLAQYKYEPEELE